MTKSSSSSTLEWVPRHHPLPDDHPSWELVLRTGNKLTTFGKLYALAEEGYLVIPWDYPRDPVRRLHADLSVEDAKRAAKLLLMVGEQA